MLENHETLTADWHYPTEIKFGPGRILELPDYCWALKIKRPLIVTDPTLGSLPIITDTVAMLRRVGISIVVFCEIKANPVGNNVEQGVAVYHAGEHDGIIAIGGGSVLDAGKAIALMTGQNRSLWDFEDIGQNYLRVNENAIAPLIAIPTTAGSGAEVTRSAAIIDEVSKTKKNIFHPRLMPNLVICDPKLTLNLPPHISAATGFDALAHAFEAYCSPGFHPYADGIALQALKLIKNWLPIACRNGSDLRARAYMLAASSMAATAMQKGLGAVHALSHPLGGIYDSHHGTLNAVLLPHVIKHNRPAIEEKMLAMALFLNLPNPSFQSVLGWILSLRAQLELPFSLQQLGIHNLNPDVVVQLALQEPPLATNPLKLGPEMLKAILIQAMTGSGLE